MKESIGKITGKRVALLFLLLSLVWTGSGLYVLPMQVDAADLNMDATYLGEDTTRQGSWIGVYGNDGYVLPYYQAQTTLGRDATVPGSIVQLPSYVSSYSLTPNEVTMHYVYQSPTTDARALETPDSAFPRKKLLCYSALDFTFTFQVTDTAEHLFTIYVTDFMDTETINEEVSVMDSTNTVRASRIVSGINGGKYISFKVKGTFKVKFHKVTGDYAYVQGLFFDALTPNTISDVNTNVVKRNITLNWTNSDISNKVAVQRKLTSEPDSKYSQIASLNGDVTTYTDQNLLADTSYTYRLLNFGSFKYSDPTVVTAQTPSYTPTNITFPASSITVPAPGQAATLQATLENPANNQPLAGKEIHFELQGQYVGTYIPAAIGSVITDANGLAELTYTPPYSGEYTIRAYFPHDDVDELDASSNTLPFTVNVVPWTQPPALLSVSDAVRAGELISINGYGFDPNVVEVKIAPANGSPPVQPPALATSLEIVQADTDRNMFVVARLPANAAPGEYDLWVRNSFGWSAPISLNGARPQYISEYEAYKGLTIDLVGRNFDAREYGGVLGAEVRLNNGTGGIYPAVVSQVNPFKIRFVIPNTPTVNTLWWVEVRSIANGRWVRLPDQQLKVIAKTGNDPLGLGVAWAQGFAWSNVFNVTDYGAVPGDNTDDTAAVAAAIDAAATAGGVVFFPNGSYDLTSISLPAHVILLGENEFDTQLVYNGNGNNFINSSGNGKTLGHQGVANLTIRLGVSGVKADAYLWLGHDWGVAVSDYTQRTAKEIFVVNVNLDAPLNLKVSPVVSNGAAISWSPPAYDFAGVTQYRIYKNGELVDTVPGTTTSYVVPKAHGKKTADLRVCRLALLPVNALVSPIHLKLKPEMLPGIGRLTALQPRSNSKMVG